MKTMHFDQLYQQLQCSAELLAKNTLQEFEKQAKADGQQVLEGLKANLQRWAEEVEAGALTKEDFAFLLQGEKSLDEMIALKQAGLAAIQVDTFKNSLINLIIGTLTSVIKV